MWSSVLYPFDSVKKDGRKVPIVVSSTCVGSSAIRVPSFSVVCFFCFLFVNFFFKINQSFCGV